MHLRVASTALCIASPVFRAMLSDRFLEGQNLSACAKTGQVYALELPEDDPDALITLCHILHFNNYKVPRSISAEALAKLCVLLDKYVCTLAAASWIDYWFSHSNSTKAPASESESLEAKGGNSPAQASEGTHTAMWLYISWVTGDGHRFRQYSAAQIMSIPSLDYMDKSHQEWFDRLPSCIQDALINASQLALEEITNLVDNFCVGKLSPCKAQAEQYMHENRGRGSRAVVPTSKDCEAHAIGALVQALQGKQLQPGVTALSILTHPHSWSGSVSQLFEVMEGIADVLATTRPFIPPHHQCLHGKILYRKLKELRYLKNNAGLELTDFRSRHG